MKITKLLPVVALVGAIFMFGCNKTDSVNQAPQKNLKSVVATGNGAPSGPHYNLNIIGVPKGKTADMTGDNGGRIFVSLTGNTKINLAPGTDFQVTDANGTDANGASFTMPTDVTQCWTVWARVLGKPGGKADITTCADSVLVEGDYVAAEITCGNTLSLERVKNAKFVNVSSYLLYVTITADVWVGGVMVLAAGTYDLFDPALAGYFWDYDNNGLKLLQLRFYPTTCVR